MLIVTTKDRQSAAQLIEAFLLDKIDDNCIRVFQALKDSADPTVRLGREILEDYADDYEDDPRRMDKADWDHLERVRLALLSGSQLERKNYRRYGLPNVLAGLCVIAFAICVMNFGFLRSLIPAVAALALIAWLISKRPPLTRAERSPYFQVIQPFTSFDQLAGAYRSTSEFTKHRIPGHRRFNNIARWYHWPLGVLFAAPLTPLMLALLALPLTESEYTVVG